MLQPTASVSRVGSAATWVGIALLFAAQVWIRYGSSLVHDTAWFLNAVEQMQQGRRLYADLIEVNPPLGLWLTWPVVKLSQMTAASDVAIVYGTLFAITLGSIIWAWRILAKSTSLSLLDRNLLGLCLAGLLLFYPGPNFAQREHLLILLFIPWLMLRSAAPQTGAVGMTERIMIGAVAAIAVSIKPQSIAAPVAVELFILWRTRDWRNAFAAENIAAAAVVIAYVAAVLVFTPEYLDSMVKIGQVAYYPYYGYPFKVILANITPAVLATAFGLILSGKLAQPHRDIVKTMLIAALGFIISYLIQNKGFQYQALPAGTLGFAALMFALIVPPCERGVALAMRGALLLAVSYFLATAPQLYWPHEAVLRRSIKDYAPEARSVFIASTRVSDAFPIVRELRLAWASTLPTQWFAPYVATHGGEGAADTDPVVRLARRTTVDDLLRWQPDLVLVDEGQHQLYVPGGKFDYVSFWSRDERFVTLWQQYKRQGKIDNFAVYTR